MLFSFYGWYRFHELALLQLDMQYVRGKARGVGLHQKQERHWLCVEVKEQHPLFGALARDAECFL